ncbi:M15 family metallopeptidase [Lentibacillus daqui]|uniref:M15 family metallopeptidase n=1 Tax=Lentibacillus daqui TaxID=2911514 RepID=UPI0022B1762B|nr:M15 family metallopeptidase [Lentibacillus daqui]
MFNYKESIPIRENGDKLVALSQLSEKIVVKPHYFHANIPGSINECYLRSRAADRLIQASERLPSHHFFVVLDAWRPYEVQLELYQRLKKKLQLKGYKGNRLDKELSQYVDKPSKDPSKPSNHLTGGAIDLVIATKQRILDFGTSFDEFTEKAHTDFYEKKADLSDQETIFRNNRRLLKGIMENAGFTNFKNEWWHYDYGNQNWAFSTGSIAYYNRILDYKKHLEPFN